MIWRPWPYAATAIIQYEWVTNLLNVWVIFKYPMDQLVKPAHGLWTCKVNDVPKAVTVSAWQDEWTILLTVPDVLASPDRVTLEYDGPSSSLKTTWDKQWEPWGPIRGIDMVLYKRPSFVDRGDPTAFDFTLADFTTDFVWHDLDLSALVPPGAMAAVLKLSIITTNTQKIVYFRKNGNVQPYNVSFLAIQVANTWIGGDLIVALDTERKVQYKIHAATWTAINAIIAGWFV